MRDDGRAWVTGESPRDLARRLNAAHDTFVATGDPGPRVRPLVAKSWLRCLRDGMDPETSLAPLELVDDELEHWRAGHPLAAAMPIIRKLLVQDASDAGLLAAVSDAAGRLLWVEGQTRLRTRAERIHFVEGAVWSEARAGTNAPGTALRLDQPVQIFAAEHLSRQVTPWSCSAAPIHDPDTGAVLGALDLTGGHYVAAPHTLALVRATVAAVEGELRLQRLISTETAGHRLPRVPATPASYVQVLGRATATLQQPGGITRLSLRHGEMLTLLGSRPDGMSGQELAAALHEQDTRAVTIRAEISRLRQLVAPLGLASRPYRLVEPLACDAAEVEVLIAAGDLSAAVDRYRGPILPASDAPGVVRLRVRLHERLREALLRRGDPDLLLRFADTDHGRWDWQLWHTARDRLPPTSPRLAQVEQHLAYVDAELGS